jgi:tight adherence protein B
MLQLVIMATVFLGVTAVVLMVGLLMRGQESSITDERLNIITGALTSSAGGSGNSARLMFDADERAWKIEEYINRHFNLRKYLEQADCGLNVPKLLVLMGALAAGGTALAPLARCPWAFAPLVGLVLAPLPLAYAWFMRGRRLNAFTRQLPEALELMGRALRSGHSLASGINLVAEEMAKPISTEFNRVFEAQNLGRPLEEALQEMAERVPTLDFQFFTTAVILQRQTGGDLAEILDKIGHLVRERFKIWGQIQALTGEGRLSAIVLLGLPPGLFVMMWRMNREYAMTLFTDPMGQQMLLSVIVLQLLGAFVIKKIIDIKV